MIRLQLTAAIGAAGLAVSGAAVPAVAAGEHTQAAAAQAAAAPTISGRATATAGAGQGGKIAFTRMFGSRRHARSWVYVMAGDGSHLRRLVEGSHPSWSRNGRRIAFTGPAGGIYVMNAAGGPATRLPIDPWYGMQAEDPAWSPDGRQLAVSRCQILVMDADGSNQRQLTSALCDGEMPPDRSPAWSPDGRTIAFARQDDLRESGALYVVPASGGQARQLTSASYYTWDSTPAWSPDGSRIAFQEFANDNRLYVMRSDGRHLRLLHDGYTPAWSPNGRRIVFGNDGDLFVMSAKGRHVKRLTHGRGYDYSPAWFGAAPTRTTVNATPEPAVKGATVTIAGKVTKVGIALPQAAVTIRFKATGAHRYTTVTKLRTGPAGRYSLTATAHRTGVWQAVHPASAATLASCATDKVIVRRS